MTTHEQTTELIYAAIDDLNKQRDASQRIEKSADTILTGSLSKLDSLGLVTFIVSVEEKIDEQFDQTLNLTSFEFMQTNGNQSLTAGFLIEYIAKKIDTNDGN